jgi:hypothetical protein
MWITPTAFAATSAAQVPSAGEPVEDAAVALIAAVLDSVTAAATDLLATVEAGVIEAEEGEAAASTGMPAAASDTVALLTPSGLVLSVSVLA